MTTWTRFYADLTCRRCKSSNERDVDSTWRWDGEDWNHRCADLDPQVGYAVMRATDDGVLTPDPWEVTR